MNDTDAAARLADVLFRIDTDRGNRGGLSGRSYEDVAAALLPIVREIADQRAAEELEAAAFPLSAGDEQSGGCGPWHDFADGLRARAAALRGEAGR